LLGVGQLHFLLWQARASNEKARRDLGVEFTPLDAGISRTVRWMADSGRL
jgi:nucleoside-diphosphate-sugar epimerase